MNFTKFTWSALVIWLFFWNRETAVAKATKSLQIHVGDAGRRQANKEQWTRMPTAAETFMNLHEPSSNGMLNCLECHLERQKDKLEDEAARLFRLFQSRTLVPTTKDFDDIAREANRRMEHVLQLCGMAWFHERQSLGRPIKLYTATKLGESAFKDIDGPYGRCKASWSLVRKQHDDNVRSTHIKETAKTNHEFSADWRRKHLAKRLLRTINIAAHPYVYKEVRWQELKKSKGVVIMKIRTYLSKMLKGHSQNSTNLSIIEDNFHHIKFAKSDYGMHLSSAMVNNLDEVADGVEDSRVSDNLEIEDADEEDENDERDEDDETDENEERDERDERDEDEDEETDDGEHGSVDDAQEEFGITMLDDRDTLRSFGDAGIQLFVGQNVHPAQSRQLAFVETQEQIQGEGFIRTVNGFKGDQILKGRESREQGNGCGWIGAPGCQCVVRKKP
ncbi:hypothetical protein BC829DRAFT_422383 [Chytridium lagenaria]|nr:hypothetical protein BC829DRAFT_422383 [Chytridium lagenaria]